MRCTICVAAKTAAARAWKKDTEHFVIFGMFSGFYTSFNMIKFNFEDQKHVHCITVRSFWWSNESDR